MKSIAAITDAYSICLVISHAYICKFRDISLVVYFSVHWLPLKIFMGFVLLLLPPPRRYCFHDRASFSLFSCPLVCLADYFSVSRIM